LTIRPARASVGVMVTRSSRELRSPTIVLSCRPVAHSTGFPRRFPSPTAGQPPPWFRIPERNGPLERGRQPLLQGSMRRPISPNHPTGVKRKGRLWPVCASRIGETSEWRCAMTAAVVLREPVRQSFAGSRSEVLVRHCRLDTTGEDAR
jgi:hypothetical protein